MYTFTSSWFPPYAYFVVYGEEFSPKDLSRAIGLEATSTGSDGGGSYDHGVRIIYWDYQPADTIPPCDLTDSIELMCQIIEDRIEPLLKFMARYRLQAKCVIVIQGKPDKAISPMLPLRINVLMQKLGGNIQLHITS